MPTVELDIRQLADEGGTKPFAPVTVTDAVLDEDGNTLTDILDEINAGLTPQKVNVTSMISGLSITDDESYVIGKLAVINVRLKTTVTISLSGQGFINNMPLGRTQLADGIIYVIGILRVGNEMFSFGISNEQGAAVAIGTSNQSLGSIPANTNIWISCQYVIADN